ncbi:autotransporter domain-containing protein [Chitinophaga sp. YIM B06452]|uniref:autotransporter domain-containing protein n=1 Tax=Chitinophaga sp. YIM B06452 TaxID=3082158 RepID=UPI0031FE540B
MNGQGPDIERLLRAAAQQEPEPAAPAVKEQAWEQLRHMLDGQAAPPPGGRGWWFVLAEVFVLLAVGLLFLFNSGHGLKSESVTGDSVAAESDLAGGSVDSAANAGKAGNSDRVADEKFAEKNNDSAEEGSFVNKSNDSIEKAGKENDSGVDGRFVEKNNDKENNDGLAKNTLSKAAWEVHLKRDGDKAEKNENNGPGNTNGRGEGAGKGGKEKIEKAGKTLTDADKPVDKRAGNTGKMFSGENTGYNAGRRQDSMLANNRNPEENAVTGKPGIPNSPGFFPLSLEPVYPYTSSTQNVVAASQRLPLKPHDFPVYSISPLNLKAAVIGADRRTWAGNLQVEYTYRLSPAFAFRPSAGLTYLAGADNAYEHFYQDVRPDTGTTFKVDTARTWFTLKSTLHANIGLQLAYNAGKWSVFTGITYQYQLMQQGRDSSVPGSYNIPFDSLPHYPDRFNANKLPGRNFVQWQAGVDYQLSPVWRIGLQYNLGWGGSNGKGFMNDIPRYPNRQSLELQVRYYFRRKN